MFQKLLWTRQDSPKTLPILRKRLFKIIVVMIRNPRTIGIQDDRQLLQSNLIDIGLFSENVLLFFMNKILKMTKLYLLKIHFTDNDSFNTKVGCIFPVVVIYILPGFGRSDHREDAYLIGTQDPHLRFRSKISLKDSDSRL